jgi:hypothetical protein
VRAVVYSGWRAFSNPASLAAFEILVATRADREPWFETHLVDLADQLTRLGRALDPAGRGRHRQTTGNLLWATLRGLALAQMVVKGPMDFSYELQALVDLLTMHVESRRGDRDLPDR